MSVTTTKLLSSGEFYKLRNDAIPDKSASANVSFYTNNSKMQILSCDTLVTNERYVELSIIQNTFFKNISRNNYFSVFPSRRCLCNDCVKKFSSRLCFSGTPITEAKFFSVPETAVMF